MHTVSSVPSPRRQKMVYNDWLVALREEWPRDMYDGGPLSPRVTLWAVELRDKYRGGIRALVWPVFLSAFSLLSLSSVPCRLSIPPAL